MIDFQKLANKLDELETLSDEYNEVANKANVIFKDTVKYRMVGIINLMIKLLEKDVEDSLVNSFVLFLENILDRINIYDAQRNIKVEDRTEKSISLKHLLSHLITHSQFFYNKIRDTYQNETT